MFVNTIKRFFGTAESHSISADLAARCINIVAAQLSDVHNWADLESEFSRRLQLALSNLYTRFPDCEVPVYWGYGPKGKPDEMHRRPDHESSDQVANLVRHALLDLNQDYDSVEFLTALSERTFGDSHVSNYRVLDTGDMALAVFPRIGGTKTPITLTLPAPNSGGLRSFLDELYACMRKSLSETKGANVRADAVQQLRHYCDSWKACAPTLVDVLNEHREPNDSALELTQHNVSSACAHFAMLLLLGLNNETNNRFYEMSYVLSLKSPGRRLPSSLVAYWPLKDSKRYTDSGLPFLLHVLLGQVAARLSTGKAIETTLSKGARIFGHDLKNRLAELNFAKRVIPAVEKTGDRQAIKIVKAVQRELLVAYGIVELFRVIGKYSQGGLPLEWCDPDYANWPVSFKKDQHVPAVVNFVRALVEEISSAVVFVNEEFLARYGLSPDDVSIRCIDGCAITTSCRCSEREDGSILSDPRALHVPPLKKGVFAPRLAVFAGLAELVRNAAKATAGGVNEIGYIMKTHGSIHLDYRITQKNETAVKVELWNPYFGDKRRSSDDLQSSTIKFLCDFQASLSAVSITPPSVVVDYSFAVKKGAPYIHSAFEIDVAQLRFIHPQSPTSL